MFRVPLGIAARALRTCGAGLRPSLGAGLLGVPVGGGPSPVLFVAPLAFRAPGVLAYGLAPRLEARPGPATALRHCGRSLRRPPHLWGLVYSWV